ncbi:glycoside hydrolase family 72 protein [Cucurbitaria berberidis CBS 394.84]|uniref:1,3-beta-glucanosyltransferase n=1 Tax=Cucurbitaria berberidis CBS 394.84 TaxID=1168544 RepID=A0A9P4LDV8_9PLEO|nr:glycoside hydrolase family 72 protein [Cucurbitaria berberidis CBS 394.84]KAF1850504.1 glycoside hydrolase family 72 protein [Cucurbitaria berberidis CBS 394.84]
MVTIQRLITAALVACRTATGIPTIEIKGSKFFTSEGNQFYVKGITYEFASSLSSSYLTNGQQCKIDAKLIGATGANVVRVYSIDPTLNLDECMQAFADEGIYVICDMSTPTFFINREKPIWTLNLRNQFAKVLDGLHKYDNLLALFAGNEVINDVNTTIAAPAIKAVIADMKGYRDLMQYRKIPIGYSSTDETTTNLLQNYLDCGNEDIAADFFALDNYGWCGESSMAKSGYDALYARANGYDIPIFLSETGCNHVKNRSFNDQVALLGRDMNDRYSGSIIYEWTMGVNKYGLVEYSNDQATGTPKLLADYTALQSRWSTLNPVGVKATAYDPTLTKRDCPQSTSGVWLVEAKAGTEIPTLGLSGFTAPTGRQASATGRIPTSSIIVGSGSSSDSNKLESGRSGGSTKLGGGAIAGIVMGAIFLFLVMCGILLFLWRKNRPKKEVTVNPGDDAPLKGELDATSRDMTHQPIYQELSGAKYTQELGPSHAQYELRTDERPGELPDQRDEHQHLDDTGHYAPEFTDQEPAAEPSPHVQAQRRREMEWLEMEEMRMRQRREQLMKQGGAG